MTQRFEVWPVPPYGVTKHIESGKPWFTGTAEQIGGAIYTFLLGREHNSQAPALFIKQAGAAKHPNRRK